MINKYKELCSGSWSDEAIAALNARRVVATDAPTLNTRALSIGSGVNAKAIVDAMAAPFHGYGVCRVSGLGTCLIDASGMITTETGRKLNKEGRVISATDKMFTPCYPKGLEYGEAFVDFIMELHASSVDDRIAFMKKYARETPHAMGYYSWQNMLRFVILNQNSNGHNYGTDPQFYMPVMGSGFRCIRQNTGNSADYDINEASGFTEVEAKREWVTPAFFSFWKGAFRE